MKWFISLQILFEEQLRTCSSSRRTSVKYCTVLPVVYLVHRIKLHIRIKLKLTNDFASVWRNAGTTFSFRSCSQCTSWSLLQTLPWMNDVHLDACFAKITQNQALFSALESKEENSVGTSCVRTYLQMRWTNRDTQFVRFIDKVCACCEGMHSLETQTRQDVLTARLY